MAYGPRKDTGGLTGSILHICEEGYKLDSINDITCGNPKPNLELSTEMVSFEGWLIFSLLLSSHEIDDKGLNLKPTYLRPTGTTLALGAVKKEQTHVFEPPTLDISEVNNGGTSETRFTLAHVMSFVTEMLIGMGYSYEIPSKPLE